MNSFTKTEQNKIVMFAVATAPNPSDDEIISWVCSNAIAFTGAFNGRGILRDLSATESAVIEILREEAETINQLKEGASTYDEEGDGWIADASGEISIHLTGATYWDTQKKLKKSVGGTANRLQITRKGGHKVGNGKVRISMVNAVGAIAVVAAITSYFMFFRG
ncbi:hypothetical protein HBH70_151620 [Parastagonospora nodorum]|nr:hypothetical protein HBH53_167310 [Parastagonospora nodorum]KAH3965454.1 hypothetical protein HBH51_150930 [Parastagonospora nodorum]KAH4000050.1 hypothetical protein HBI10_110550 [Parastagonospora nodorum]KAH4022138.1 hypothetical protein HBI13_098660 [Parastagonospora nodorum]KAH4027861.1 hypothetical protein HBI09_144190 [Parastagonospora nodorum]